jgi:hypothetical protein
VLPSSDDDGPITIPLGAGAVQGNGTVSFALATPDPAGATWSSTEGDSPPELFVRTRGRKGFVLDGLSKVFHERLGSSDPTNYSAQHRLARASGGRLFTVIGRHSHGVQLAWRDPGGGWQTVTRGRLSDGLLKRDSGTGDWPASIAIARDSNGVEHAWVIWSAPSIGAVPKRIVEMRRLSRLRAAGGPTVGPRVQLVSSNTPAPTSGVARSDLTFERQTDGSYRGIVTWLSQTAANSHDLKVGWLDDLDAARPSLEGTTTLFTGSADRGATLEADDTGARLLVRGPGGDLQLFRHETGDALTTWQPMAAGVDLPSQLARYPVATILDSGETVAVVESDTNDHVLTVQRWSADGLSVDTVQTLAGYMEPSITSDGERAWVLAVRTSDGSVISRLVIGSASESATDVVRVSATTAPHASYPNALRRIEDRMSFVVRGESSGTSRSSVMAFQRRL